MQIGNSLGGQNYFQNRTTGKQVAKQQNAPKLTNKNNKNVEQNKQDDIKKLDIVESKLSTRARCGLRAGLNILTGWWTPFGFPGLGDVLFPDEDTNRYGGYDMTTGQFTPGTAYQKSNEGAPSAPYGKNDLKNDLKPKKEFLA